MKAKQGVNFLTPVAQFQYLMLKAHKTVLIYSNDVEPYMLCTHQVSFPDNYSSLYSKAGWYLVCACCFFLFTFWLRLRFDSSACNQSLKHSKRCCAEFLLITYPCPLYGFL